MVPKYLLLVLLGFVFSSLPLPAKVDLKPSGFVNDYAGVLPPAEKSAIENLLGDYEKQSGNEIAVVIIKSLDRRDLDQYAHALFNDWGVGKKDKDNGVLLLISLDDRTMRIEVGYGLEHVLTDGRCGEIIRTAIAPRFREGKIADGITAGIQDMQKLIRGETPEEKPQTPKGGPPPLVFIMIWQGMCLLFAFLIMGVLGLCIQAAIVLTCDIGTWIGLSQKLPLGGYFAVAGLLVPFFLIFGLSIAASIARFFVKRKLQKHYGRHWKEYWPFWIGSYSTGSSSSGGFSSGGGFGGGSSGGGGASGSW